MLSSSTATYNTLTHTYTPPLHTHTLCPSASLVKGKSAEKDLPLVNDGYLSYSDAVTSDSQRRRFRGCREGSSYLPDPIRIED